MFKIILAVSLILPGQPSRLVGVGVSDFEFATHAICEQFRESENFKKIEANVLVHTKQKLNNTNLFIASKCEDMTEKSKPDERSI